MSKEKRRVPKLRFPGFTEDWEQRKFGEIYERAGQKNDLTYGIDKIISVANMYFKKDVTVGSEEYLKTYNVFKLGDIAFEGHTNKEYRYGRFVENTIGDGIVSHIFDVFTPKINLDINFWKDLIKYEPIMGPILRRCTKASRMMSNLTTKEFLEEQILCPTLEEQKLIGEFIVSLDKNITLHQRKLDNLKLKKKALLQKLFPKNGERYPELRFPGFTDAWEQREFSDIFSEVKSGLSRMLSNDDIGLPVVRANNINDGQLNLVDDIKYWYKNDPQGANTNNYLIEQGDILINFINSEAKMGTAAYVTRRPERDTIYTTNILRCKVNDEYNPYFIYSLTFLNSYKNYIASITKPAVNQASFTTVDFKKYSIKIPTVKEQNQIADLIETFNKLITLHQRKLDHLQLQKKALLQQMFV